MNQLITIQGVRGFIDENGMAQLNLEDVARGLGFTDKSKGSEYVKWDRVRQYLDDLKFSTEVSKESFVPENIFYRLAMKAKNEAAEFFQSKVADEILPAIRKTGTYSVPTLTPNEAIALSLKQTAEMMTKVPVLESRLDQVEQKVDEQITLNSGEQNQLKKSILTRVCQFEQDKDARKPLFRLLYKELYERYDVPSYKDILRKDLNEALQFVGAWRPKRSDLDRIAN
ncbi:ORF6C domain-containing protein [Paenibacillus alvei]|uniref:ORF6C domain-containing protein n=1 Tax=Paenibacillus alvei TaxID=44250 RepID=A0ABT4E9W1_PAEAL|nr:ORF6C domain-containing protein [Paenibacillus alvei]MCY9530533.1 ORF6C domain-containing protein [Paenibacillus alvei]